MTKLFARSYLQFAPYLLNFTCIESEIIQLTSPFKMNHFNNMQVNYLPFDGRTSVKSLEQVLSKQSPSSGIFRWMSKQRLLNMGRLLRTISCVLLFLSFCTACSQQSLPGKYRQVDSDSNWLIIHDNINDKGDWDSAMGKGGRYTVEGDTITFVDGLTGAKKTGHIQGNEIQLDGVLFRKE